MKKDFLIICLLLILAIPAVKDLFLPGGFTSHDLTHHIVRQIDMDRLLSEDQFPPRWSGQLNNGYGYPLFLFNYPLPSLLGEIFHKLGFNFVDSVKAVLFTSMILAELGMYLFLKASLNSAMAAFLGGIFYLYAPVRFLNVYVSAAVGSALALGILPFVFLSLVEVKKKKKQAIVLGAFSLAGLILAHNVTALIFAPVLLAFALVIGGKRVMSQIGLMFLLGLGLSAWFWLPAVWEKQYIRFGEIYNGFFKDQFVSIRQILHSPWGYGLSHPQKPELGDMSYQLGLIHIGVVLVYGLWLMVNGKKSKDQLLGIFALTTFFLSIFLMLKISLPVWEKLPFLSLVQFPLRFQAIAVFAASITAALLVKYLPYKQLIFIVLLVLVIYANRNHWKINEQFNPPLGYYLNLKTTATSYGEHLPKWGRLMDQPPVSKLELIKGLGNIRIISDNSVELLAEVKAITPATLRFNQFYFPGWQVRIDDKVARINYLNKAENYGLIIFDVDKGTHRILAQFKNTPDRNLADLVSFISMILWLILLCRLSVRI